VVVVLQELFMLSVSQEIYTRKVRLFLNRGELFECQYQLLCFNLLVNIDRCVFARFGATPLRQRKYEQF